MFCPFFVHFLSGLKVYWKLILDLLSSSVMIQHFQFHQSKACLKVLDIVLLFCTKQTFILTLCSGQHGLHPLCAQLLGAPALLLQHVGQGQRPQHPLQALRLRGKDDVPVPLRLIGQRSQHAGPQPLLQQPRRREER